MINIMLVEPEKKLQVQFRQVLKRYPDMVLVAETDSEDTALAILEEFQVDVIILDLELRQGSGILLLKKLQYLAYPKPFIMVVTHVESGVIFDTIRVLGVDYIWKKQNKVSFINTLIETIEISKLQIKANSGATAEQMREKVNKNTLMRMMGKRVEKCLEAMGFSYKYIGTKYLNEALLLVIVNPDMEMNITKRLYPQMAKRFKCSADGIEKNIRVTIQEVWSRRDKEGLKVLYPFEWNEKTGRPTNLEFIRNVRRQILR